MTPIPVYDLVRHWDEIAAILAPAVATDRRSIDEVKVALISRDMTAWMIPGGMLVTAEGQSLSADIRSMWILYVAGKATGRGEYRALSTELAALGRQRGCKALSIEGRRAAKWARVLGGFKHVKGTGDDALFRRLI